MLLAASVALVELLDSPLFIEGTLGSDLRRGTLIADCAGYARKNAS